VENTEIADFTYHSFVVVVIIFGTWLLIALLVWAGLIRIPMLVRCMRFVENVALALWVGLIAANVAILASALPYIYTQQDPSMKCGSLGIAYLAINMIPQSMLIIITLAAFFYGGRACISERSPVVRSMFNYVAFVGSVLWMTAAATWFTIFAWFLESVIIVVHNPPPLPPNLSDSKACSEFIGTAAKPSNLDPFGVWLRILP
jgi:hypothetical protein